MSDAQGVPPGWYPDPLATASLRFWDGGTWTNHVHPQIEPGSQARSGNGKAVMAIGGGALAISPFLTWVNVILLGGLNLFQLLRVSGHPTGLVWIAVGIGALVFCLSLVSNDQGNVRALAVLGGLAVGVPALLLFSGMVDSVRHAQGLVRVSFGPWVGLLGCVGMVVGGLMSTRRRQ